MFEGFFELSQQVNVSSISVSFDDSVESLGLDDDAPVNIIKLANDVTHKRLKRSRFLVFGFNKKGRYVPCFCNIKKNMQ